MTKLEQSEEHNSLVKLLLEKELECQKELLEIADKRITEAK